MEPIGQIPLALLSIIKKNVQLFWVKLQMTIYCLHERLPIKINRVELMSMTPSAGF